MPRRAVRVSPGRFPPGPRATEPFRPASTRAGQADRAVPRSPRLAVDDRPRVEEPAGRSVAAGEVEPAVAASADRWRGTAPVPEPTAAGSTSRTSARSPSTSTIFTGERPSGSRSGFPRSTRPGEREGAHEDEASGRIPLPAARVAVQAARRIRGAGDREGPSTVRLRADWRIDPRRSAGSPRLRPRTAPAPAVTFPGGGHGPPRRPGVRTEPGAGFAPCVGGDAPAPRWPTTGARWPGRPRDQGDRREACRRWTGVPPLAQARDRHAPPAPTATADSTARPA